MTAENIEITEVEDDDERHVVLQALAQNRPWVFVVANIDEYPAIDMKVDVGGGVRDVKTIRAILERAYEALPDEE